MSSFPKPLDLPEAVSAARAERRRTLARVSIRGALCRLLIVVLELGGFIYFGSQTLLLDAMATGFDVLTSVVLLFFIWLADRPPDDDHPLGHGRYEPLAGLQLGLLLTLLGTFMLFQEGHALLSSDALETLSPYVWIIPLFAAALLEINARALTKAAKEESSSALLAEARHFRIDVANSLLAAAILGIGATFPTLSGNLDLVGALLIAALMCGLGALSAWDNLHQIMDRIPDPSYFERVKRAALRASGVEETEKIRIQCFGPDAHVGIDVEVEPTLSVEKAHAISQQVRYEIQKDWPQVRDVIVHIEPYYPGDH